MSDTPWLDGAVSVDGKPTGAAPAAVVNADKPWLAGAIAVDGKPLGERLGEGRGESARQRLDRRTNERRGSFDPSVPTGSYLLNEAKKTPGSILGLVPDVAEWLGRKATGQPTDFGGNTRAIQKFMGADLGLKPPSQGVEDLGTLQTNVLGSLPFAGGAVAAGRGVLGAATEMLSGVGGGLGEIVGKQAEGHAPSIIGNIVGSAAGYRAGNLVEKLVPVAKDAFRITGLAPATKEQKAAAIASGLKEGTPEYEAALAVDKIRVREGALLKARGITESTPEFKNLVAKRMEVAQRETVADLQKSFAQEDIAALNQAFDEYKRVQATFPGFRASVGEVTGNEPALALQAKLESKNIPALEDRGARIRGNQEAIQAQREALMPKATGGVKSVMRGVQGSLDDELRAIGDKATGYETDLRAISDKSAGAAVPVAEAGSALKDASKEGYAASKARADQRYSAFRAAVGEDAPSDVSNVTAKLKELQDRFVFDKQPEVLGRIEGVAGSESNRLLAKEAKEPPGLLATIRRMGGISSKELLDLTGESKGIIRPGLFRKDGQALDELATKLRVEEGFNIPGDSVDGGVQLLRDLIRDELRGQKSYSFANSDIMMERARNAASSGNVREIPPSMTVAQLHDLTSAANRDISRLKSSQNPDRKAIAQLQAIKDEANTAIETTLEARGNTNALGLFKDANRFFAEEHAPKYLTGVNMEVRLRNALNEERIKPERVVDAYYKPNGTTEAQRFNAQFADNGAAKEALARGVFDRYKREVIDPGNGIINPMRHDAFMRKYAAANEQYPWIAKRLEKNAVAGEVAKRMEEQRAMIGPIAESKLAQAVGTKDPELFMKQALASKRDVFNTMMKLDQEGKKNFAVAVLNKGWDEAGKGAEEARKFLDNNDNLRLLFRSAFGKEVADKQMENLQLLARGMEINSKAPKTSPMQALTEDSMKAATGTSGLQIFSALRAIGRRPGSEGWFLGVFGGQFVKAKIEANKDMLLKQQLFDPDLLMATIQSSKLNDTAQSSFMKAGRGKEMRDKLWDLTKAAVGQGTPTAAALRVPAADREER